MNYYELIDCLKNICEYAYKTGFHEMGYDPIHEIIKNIEKDLNKNFELSIKVINLQNQLLDYKEKEIIRLLKNQEVNHD